MGTGKPTWPLIGALACTCRPERDLEPFAGRDVPVAFVSGRHLEWYGPLLVDAREVLERQIADARP